jgi:hypothetical protein
MDSDSPMEMEVEATCEHGHEQRATLYTFVNPIADRGVEVVGYFETRCRSCGGDLSPIPRDTSPRLARVLSTQTENELRQEDYEEFEEVNSLVKSNDNRVAIPSGEAVRRTLRRDTFDTLTAVYPIDYGYRFIQYRIDITGDVDRLVRRLVSETIPPA